MATRRGVDATAWGLSSNSGRESVTWTPRDDRESRSRNAVVCDIRIAGEYYGATLGGDATMLPDYTLELRGLAVGVDDLERLAAFLRSWLDLPLGEQVKHPPAAECNLGSLFDQSFRMSLGRRDDILSERKPVATFRFVTGRLKGEIVFVTDQSCLREFCEGIEASLARRRGDSPPRGAA